MAEKWDVTKLYKDLYAPGLKPAMVRVPPMSFIMVDGAGAPEGEQYQSAVGLLYTLSFTIKFSKMGAAPLPGYFEYKMPPLEGLWALGPEGLAGSRSGWTWTAMIRQPEFVDEAAFGWALAQAAAKKPELDFSAARLAAYDEGLCVQALHKGPYAEEPATLARMLAYAEENDLKPDEESGRRHHEIYMGDPRKTRPENLRTVLRVPVVK